MNQLFTKPKLWLLASLIYLLTPCYLTAQITLEATYPTTNLQRLNLQFSGEKWYYANDSTQQILFFNADHSPWKTVKYPSEVNKKVSLATTNLPISQTTFKTDNLLELIWFFKDTVTQRERIRVLNEQNDTVLALAEGNFELTVSELEGSPTKLFVENRESYESYTTTIFGLPNIVFEKTYANASDLRRQRFSYAGEKYYFKNRKSNLLEIYNPNHTRWKQPISIPVFTNELIVFKDPIFFADDKIFNPDTLVEFAFTYWHGNGYPLTKIVSENGIEILKTNSESSFILDRKIGQPDKIILTFNQSINTVNTQYRVTSLPYPIAIENIYYSPVQRILFKNFGARYINIEYALIRLFNLSHLPWKDISLVTTPSYYFTNYTYYSSPPIVSDSIVNSDSLLEVIWTEWNQTLRKSQLRITSENGTNIASIPNARYFQVSQLDNLSTKLITKMWDSTRLIETKVWRFTPRTAIKDPSVTKVLNVQISPNPFTSSFSISYFDVIKPLSIRLYNIMGELVYSEILTTPNSTISPPNDLPKGIYILDITDGVKRAVKRLVKM